MEGVLTLRPLQQLPEYMIPNFPACDLGDNPLAFNLVKPQPANGDKPLFDRAKKVLR